MKLAERLRGNLPLLLIWLAVCAVLIFVSREQIMSGIGWGPDDQLRQVQLRDWIAGQSWFDTVQYRIGEPDSQPMHWSRLIELPLALMVVALTPVFGAAFAETAAMVMVPLITLGFALFLVFKITRELFDRQIALLAAALTATAVPLVMQVRPMRIDHHGWQIVLALFALQTMLWSDKRRGGIALGLALALWLSISLEGLPLSIAFIALLAWRWAVSLDEGRRLFWTLASFVAGSLFLYGATQGGFNVALNYCDAISPAHLFACITGVIIILPAIRWASSLMPVRLGALVAAGVTAFSVLYFTAPQCMGGAFGQIDPLVRDYWLVNVNEGLPIWYQPWKTTFTLLGGAIIVGLGSLVFILLRRLNVTGTKNFFVIAYAFLWAFLVSLLVQRTASVAAAYGLPFMAWAVHQAFFKARRIENAVARIAASVAVVFLIMPGPLLVVMINNVTGENGTHKPGKTEHADGAPACDSSRSLERLNALPHSNIVAPFDFGPEILVLTPHSVLATSHHRNDSAMADQIRIFTSSANVARDLLGKRGIGYIVACPNEAELKIYAKRNPGGLWDSLAKNQKPDWLQPVYLRDSELLVWKIVANPLPKHM